MTLLEKAKAVEAVFQELDSEIARFQDSTTLHCKWNCGKCCFKADIEATVLEFVPFALNLYNNGTAIEWLDKLNASDTSICLILNPTREGAGLCTEYPLRGLICRLFGYSARTDKYGKKELVTCQIIKTEQAPAYQEAVDRIDEGMTVPVMNEFYFRLHSIDPDLTVESFPINTAIKKAIEVVMGYYAYR